METMTVKIKGDDCPMLMHAPILCDPLHPEQVKLAKITSKHKKTEKDHLNIDKIKYVNAIYYDEEIGIYIPTANIHASLLEGAKKNRRGPMIKSGVIFTEEKVKLDYNGPKTPEKLFENPYFVDRRSICIGGKKSSRVMVSRPRFDAWSLKVSCVFSPEVIEKDLLLESWIIAGSMVGIGAYRPHFGRYIVDVVD